MIARAINYILTLTPIGRYLDGKKTYISVGLLVLAAILELVEKLAAIFPNYAPLAVASKEGAEFLASAVETLAKLGFGGLTIGVTGKVVKAKIAKDAK